MNYNDLKAKFEKTFPNSTVTFEEVYPLKTNNGACLFVQHCVYMLADGGVCAVVLPDGELFEGNSPWSKKFRKWLCESVNIRTILKAPSGVFEHAGVKTNVVIFTKDGPTQTIQFLETNKECNEVRDMFSVTMDELVATKFSLDVGEYIEDVSENYDVPMVALGDVCQMLPTTKHYSSIGAKTGKYKFYVSSQDCNLYLDTYEVEEQSIILGNGGQANIHIDSNFTPSKHVTVCQITNNNLNIDFAYLYLKYNIHLLESKFSGAGLKWMNKEKISKIKIPLPSLEVQQQIVDELTLVEESTTTIQTRLDQLKREKEQYRKYGKKAEIRALLEGSESKMLGDVCELKGNGKTNSKNIDNNGSYPFYRASLNNPSGTHSKYDFDGEDKYILFIKSGGSSSKPLSYNYGIGKVFLVQGKIAANIAVFKIEKTNDKMDIIYLYKYLLDKQLELQKLANYATNNGNIDMIKLMKIKIPLPSLEIQEQCIALFEEKEAYIETINKKIEEHKNYLEELKALAKDVITSFC